jgi:hypothetical protein
MSPPNILVALGIVSSLQNNYVIFMLPYDSFFGHKQFFELLIKTYISTKTQFFLQKVILIPVFTAPCWHVGSVIYFIIHNYTELSKEMTNTKIDFCECACIYLFLDDPVYTVYIYMYIYM